MKLPRRRLWIPIAAVGLGVIASAHADGPQETVLAAADTWISQSQPHANHGSEQTLVLGSPGPARALVRVAATDLAAAMADRILASAHLELTIEGQDGNSGKAHSDARTVDVHRMTTEWTESGATWASPTEAGNRPRTTWSMGPGDRPWATPPTASLVVEHGRTGVISFDVTTDVAAFAAGTSPNHGWVLKRRDEGGSGRLDLRSREAGSPPRLVLQFLDATPPSITFTRPTENAYVGPDGDVVASYSDQNGVLVQSFAVTAGGVDVTQVFVVGAAEAHASIADLFSALVQGSNSLTATVSDPYGNTGTTTRTFVFDSVPPVVALEPADGAIVVSGSLLVRVTVVDDGSGVEPAAVSLTVNGSPTAIVVQGGVGVVDLAVAAGEYVLVATVDDRAGNRTQVTSSIRLTPRGIRGQVLGGRNPDDVVPVAGVRVRALDGPPVETLTDANGEFTLYGSPVGRIGVIADGSLVGFGRTNFLADVVDGVVTSLAKPIVVPPVAEDDGVEITLDAEGRTTAEFVVTSPDSLSAELRIAAGSRIVLPDDGFVLPPGRPLRISIHRLVGTLEPEPLPPAPDGQYVAPGVYSIQPAGLEIVEGYTLTLANEGGVGPGESTPLFLFSQRTGTWELKAQMVASPDQLTVTGTLNSLIAVLVGARSDVVTDAERAKVGLYSRLVPAGAQVVYGGPVRTTIFNEFLFTQLGARIPGGASCFPQGNPGLQELVDVFSSGSGQPDRLLKFRPSGQVPDGPVGLDLILESGGTARGAPVVYLDRTPPSAGDFKALPGGFVGPQLFTNSPRIEVKAADSMAGVHRVIFEHKRTTDPWPPSFYAGRGTDVQILGRLGPQRVHVDNRILVTGPDGIARWTDVSLADGTYDVRAWVVDTANNVTVAPSAAGFRVTIDRAPPAISVVFQQPSLRSTAAVITYVATDNVSLATVELLRGGVVVDSRSTANGSFTLSPSINYGTYTYTLRVRDQAGNVTSASTQQTYTFDNLAPTGVTVTASPAQLAALGPVTVQVSAIDQFAGLGSFDLERARLGSSTFTSIALNVPFPGNPVNSSTTVSVTDPSVPNDGRWVYRATVRDTLGNAVTVAQMGDVLVDTSPATVVVTVGGVAVDGAVLAAGPHTFAVTLEDLVGVDPASLRVLLDGATLPLLAAPVTIPVGPELRRTTASALVVRVVEGAHELRVEGRDLLGNAFAYVAHFTQDHRPPTIDSLVITPTGLTNSSSLGLTATYHDDLGVDPTRVRLILRSTSPSGVITTTDVTAQAAITASNLSWTGTVPDGQYDLVLTVTDLSGRAQVQTSATVSVDTQDPTLTLSAPPASPTLSVDPRPVLSASFSDPGLAGIAPQDVRLFVDSVEVTSGASITTTGATFRPLTALGDGDHSFTVVVTDRAGNSATASTTFRLDVTPPTQPGKPLAGPRPYEPTTTIRWFASVDSGSGVDKYRVFRTEDGAAFSLVAETTATELTVPSPTGERTAFRVVAVDGVGNVSSPAEVLGCELVSLDDLEVQVTTALVIEVRRTDGTPVTDAVVSVRGSGVALSHVGLGVYRSNQVTVRAGTPLNLDVLVNGEAFVSGPLLPLLPEVGVTDFGRLLIAHRRLLNDVFGTAAQNPAPLGQPGLGATAGEASAVGPPVLTNGEVSLSGGFWQTIQVEGDPVISILQVPPVLCGRWVPLYFELVADLTLVNVVAEYSLDNGATWSTLTIDGATGVASLPGTPLGRRHVLLWDAGTDTAAVSIGDALVRLYPQGRPERGDVIATTVLRSFSVERVTPPAKTLDVDPSTTFELVFTHATTSDVANLTSSITLVDVASNAAIPLAFNVTDRTVVVTPQGALFAGQELQLRVAPGLLTSGEPRAFDQLPQHGGVDAFEAPFRVGGEDVTPPSLESSVPADGSSSVPAGLPIVLTFNELLDPASITLSTFVLTSNKGAVQASAQLLPDGRSVLVTPTTSTETDRCYTVSVGPGLRDLAGNALALVEHVTFTTVTTSPMTAPPPPVITSPLDGFTITTASTAPVTTTITGMSAPNTTVRLYVNGHPTGVIGQVDANGNFSFETCNLPDGVVVLSLVASTGLADSAPSVAVTGTVSTNRLGGTPPSAPGQPIRTEVLPGDGSEAYYRHVVRLTGPPGGPVTLWIDNTGLSDGFDRTAECSVPVANGGGTPYTLIPGVQVIAGLFYDAQGNFEAEIGGFQVVGNGAEVWLEDAVTGVATPKHEVVAIAPISVFSVAAGFTSAGTIPGKLTLASRRLDEGSSYVVGPVGGYPIRLKAIDENGNPTDAVRINGEPGSTGALVATDPSGALPFTIEVVDPAVRFRIIACAENAYEDRPHREPLFLGDSELFDPQGYSQSSTIVAFLRKAPSLYPSIGGMTICFAGDCPPKEPAGVRQTADTVKQESDPVLLHNGGELLSVVDLAIPSSRGPSFVFARTYKSLVLYAGPLGHRWTHGYDQRLTPGPGGVTWLTGTDRSETFEDLGGGSYKAPTGFFNRLTVTNGVGTIREADGTRLVFRSFTAASAPGKLDRIVDRHGNALRLEYGTVGSAANQLTAVIDPLERSVELLHDAFGRIRELRDFLGRSVRYEYGTHGDLIRVTSPVALTTTQGEPLLAAQQFPEGRQAIYGYTSGFADERANHLLTHVIAPAEAAALRNAARTTLEDAAVLTTLARAHNTYDLNPESANYTRVIRQRLGGSTQLPTWTGQATPEVAGGTITFDYETLPVPAGASFNHPVQKTTLVDRNGNIAEYFHNSAGQCVRLREHANRKLRPRSATLTPGYGEDPEFFERTWVYNQDGLPLSITNPSGSTWRWVYGDEDLNGDGLLTAGADRNGDGDQDDPEDVQAEDQLPFAFAPGNGTLDRLPRHGQVNLLRSEDVPDARGDTRGGRQPRVWTFSYEPVYNAARSVTNPCGNDPTYTPQNGGVNDPARYTTTRYFDYQQGPEAVVKPLLAQELGVSELELTDLLARAGVQLGRGDLNDAATDDLWVTGDVVRVEAPSVTLVPEQTLLRSVHGATLAVVSLMEHNVFGQVVRLTDPEHNVHRFEYHPEGDPNGDGVADSALAGLTGGYVKQTITDESAADPRRNTGSNAPAVLVTSQVFQDAVGNPVRSIDPRGVEHLTQWSMLNEVVRVRAASAIAGPPPGEPSSAVVALDYEALVFHDLNGRVVEVRGENAGERDGTATTVASNPYWTRKLAYNVLDDVVLTLAEVEPIAADDTITTGSPGVIVARVSYDANQNVALVTKPEGNRVAYVYDERDLLFQAVDGFGSADAATVTFHHTINGTPQLTVDAVKHNPNKWPQFPGDVTRTKYGGFDNVLCVTDAEQNCGDSVYDPCGRRVRFVRHGPPEENRPRLLEAEFFYDELGRPFRTEHRVFATNDPYLGISPTIPLPGDAVPLGETEAVAIVEQDALGRAVRAVDPKGDVSLAAWDGAGRLVSALGPEFATLTGVGATRNEVQYTYNQIGQPVSVTTVDRSPLAGIGPETFASSAAYDALGRLVQASDPVGQTGRLVYDSRSNVIAASDAKSSVMVGNLTGLSPALVNGHGNVAHSFYDGLGRPIRSEVLLKQGGVGDGQLNLNGVATNLDLSNPSNPDGKITVSQTFDRSSRLLSRSDDNGNVTAYAYDARDRATYSVGADLTVSRTIYDADSMVRQTIDRNGTVVDRSYDAIGRLLKVQATLRASNLENTGQAVEGSTTQAFEYDGLSRLRLAVDQNDPLTGGDDVATSFTYDSLGRQLTERHRFRVSSTINNVTTANGRISVGATSLDRTIARTFDLDSNRTSTTYSSGRVLDYQLDGADRLQAIRDSLGTITATEFLGGRPIASTTGRGTVSTSYSYDLKRRLTSLDHRSEVTASRVAGFTYIWNGADRRASETHLPAAGVASRTETYTYDSASRITQVAFGDARLSTSYLIDGVGNWASRTEGSQTQTTNQRQNGTYAPDLMNEVSRLATFDALGSLVKDEQQTQDANGNRIKSGEFRLSFDVFDRLVRVERTSDGATVGRYRYDALGRRVDRLFVAKGDAAGAQQQVFHVSDGAQEVEELDGSGAVVADYVWGGLYLDQCVQVRRNGQEFYLHTNSIFSVVAATNASGQVVERYAYSSIYGVASVKDASGADRPASAEIGNPWRFQGRRFDSETGFYYFRLRYLDPEAGRFVNRDPLGIWGDAGNLGNGYAFAGNDPVNRVDPWGLWTLRLDSAPTADNPNVDPNTPSTWRLMAVPEPGDKVRDLFDQIDPSSVFAGAGGGWPAAPGETVDITASVPGLAAALAGVPMSNGYQAENCYSFMFAISGGGWSRSVYHFNTTELPSGTTATLPPGANPLVPGGAVFEGRSQEEIEAALDNLVNPGGKSINFMTGQPLGPVIIPATGTFFDRADLMTIRGQLKPGDILGLYAGDELVHVTTVVLKDRSGTPWVIEKPNMRDPTQVTSLSSYFGPDVDPWGTATGPSPTTSVRIWRPADR